MKHYLKNLLIVSVILTISCTNDSEDQIYEKRNFDLRAGIMLPTNESSETDTDTISVKTFKFVYQNKEYLSFYTIDTGFVMIFSDPKISDLMNEIKSIPTLATEFGKNGVVYFYDTEEERINAAEKRSKIEIFTRSNYNYYITYYRVRMWDKPKGRTQGGEYIEVNAYCDHGNNVPNLHYFEYIDILGNKKIVDFNDKISSLQMWATTQMKSTTRPIYDEIYQRLYVTFYRDADYQGPSLTFTEVDVDYTYSQRDYLSSFDFDNKPTSFKTGCTVY